MNQDDLKRAIALAAVEQIRPYFSPHAIIGVGTGSTADHFIDALATEKRNFAAAVASSRRSAERLAARGITLVDLNAVEHLPIYVDGADEVTGKLAMIKGGGASLTREKIVAAVAERFICIADSSKRVAVLGNFPLPVDVIPMAHAFVTRRLAAIARRLGFAADIRLRSKSMNSKTAGKAANDTAPVVTDDGNYILDIHGLTIDDPVSLEAEIDAITGVVANGLFAARGADLLLLGTSAGVTVVSRG